jgi:hypothetical protein
MFMASRCRPGLGVAEPGSPGSSDRDLRSGSLVDRRRLMRHVAAGRTARDLNRVSSTGCVRASDHKDRPSVDVPNSDA